MDNVPIRLINKGQSPLWLVGYFCDLLFLCTWGCRSINKNNGKGSQYRINHEIRCKEVRLIGNEGKALGVMPIERAMTMAEQEGLDLVEISPTADPPVCKIIDYGKYLYEITKKLKESKKSQKVTTTKEVWLKPNIEKHDFETKVKNAIRFLQEGDKVKVSLRFKGREMNYARMSEELLKKFITACELYGDSEQQPRMEGRNMQVLLTPSIKKNK